ncbi:MAG TPA: T9SS type A sorting domain-containing protein [Bacteroidia bacterium]|nr:T9SS type A sorting domain-containing protein [Bacteroidia bacterium]
MKKQLLLLTAYVLFYPALKTAAQSWSSVGCSFNGSPMTMANNGTDFYFSGAGVTQIPGMSWPTGCSSAGFTGQAMDVRAMAFYNGELYASGPASFPDTSRIYKMTSGGSWIAAGNVEGWVNTLYVHNGLLYAGGSFISINGISVHNIASWNGTAWQDLAGGIWGTVTQIRCMTTYNNELIVAGDGFAPFANDIAKWNGTSWSALGSGITGAFFPMVKAVAAYNGSLYAAGRFDHAGGTAVTNIARWNGTSWSAAGAGITGGDTIVLALAVYNNQLYAGGLFNTAGGNPADNIARWNGSVWDAVGGGVTGGGISALSVFKGALVAGGGFTMAGGVSSPKIAKWTACPSTISAGGTTAFCAGGSVLLTAATGTAYQWLKNGNTISGATASTYSATTAGNYTCEITNSCGNVTSNQVAVTVNQLPAASLSGTASICNGSSSIIVVSFTNAPGPYTFVYNPGGIVVTTSSNPFSILVSPASTTTYSLVSVANATCAGTVSGSATITVNPLPSAVITPGGPTTFCSGGSVTLSAPAGANKIYQWKKGGVNIPGATLAGYTATTGGTYKVTITNTATGCSKTTASGTTVTVNALPAATITPQGPTTFCAGGNVLLQANTGAGFIYKWKKGGNYISGATASGYTASIAGTYKVEVTKPNGCSKLSGGVTVMVPCKTGENEEGSDWSVQVFPNPSAGNFVFKLSNADDKKYSIKVFDIIGNLVLSEPVNASEFIISGHGLSPGIYAAYITDGKQNRILKLIKSVN